MKRRLYFLLPDVSSTLKTVDELLLARVNSDHMHVMAKSGTPLGNLPEATILQKSDLIYGLERGLLIGGMTGIAAGVLASLSPDLVFSVGGIVLTCAFAGAIVGSWASGMVGSDIINSRIKPFEAAMDKGDILLMVDVDRRQVNEITEMIKRLHPEAHDQTLDPTIPAFP